MVYQYDEGRGKMTKKIDLDGLDFNDLQALIAEAREKSIEKRMESLVAAVEAAKAEMVKRGFTLSDLITFESQRNDGKRKASGTSGRSKVAPKYRDPANPENTWAGRGRKPLWVAERLAAGGKLEDLAI